jgi:hypothetical protein
MTWPGRRLGIDGWVLLSIPYITNANQLRANTGKKRQYPYSGFDSDYILPNFTPMLWDQFYPI